MGTPFIQCIQVLLLPKHKKDVPPSEYSKENKNKNKMHMDIEAIIKLKQYELNEVHLIYLKWLLPLTVSHTHFIIEM